MDKTLLFLVSLCITTHMLAMEPEKNTAAPSNNNTQNSIMNWRSKCIPVKTFSNNTIKYQHDFRDALINAYTFSYSIHMRKYWLKEHGTALRYRLEQLKNY